VEVRPLRGVGQRRGVGSADVVRRGDQEARRAAGRVADLVVGLRRGHPDHEFDDVARGAELAIGTSGRDLAEHVLVEIAVGVAVVHRDLVEHVDDLRQHGRVRDREAGVLHVLGVRRVVAADLVAVLLQEREHLGGHRLEHHFRVEVLETAPAQVRLARQELRVLDRLAEDARLALRRRLQVVEAAQEEQVGDLLDHLKRVADAAGPERVPDLVDSAPELTGDHGRDVSAARQQHPQVRGNRCRPLAWRWQTGQRMVTSRVVVADRCSLTGNCSHCSDCVPGSVQYVPRLADERDQRARDTRFAVEAVSRLNPPR